MWWHWRRKFWKDGLPEAASPPTSTVAWVRSPVAPAAWIAKSAPRHPSGRVIWGRFRRPSERRKASRRGKVLLCGTQAGNGRCRSSAQIGTKLRSVGFLRRTNSGNVGLALRTTRAQLEAKEEESALLRKRHQEIALEKDAEREEVLANKEQEAEQLLAPLPEYRPSAQALHSRHPVPRKLHSPARK